MRNAVTRGTMAGMPKEADIFGGGVSGNTVSVTQSMYVKEDSIPKSEPGVERKDERNRAEGEVKTAIVLKLNTVMKKEMLWIGMKTMR